MINRLIILFFLLQAFCYAQAQPVPADTSDTGYVEELPADAAAGIGAIASIPADTILAFHAVQLDVDSMQGLRKKRAFGYMSNLDSLLKAFQDEENAAAAKPANTGTSAINNFLDAPILRSIMILLALFFVAVILYHLLKDQAIFRKASPKIPAKEIHIEDDDGLQNDYDKLVHQAYKLADYRMAVRYLFLKTLQQLRDGNMIAYSREKTNSRYAMEMPQQWRNDFSRLVFHYEHAWYGNFKISREQFTTIEANFSAFLQKI